MAVPAGDFGSLEDGGPFARLRFQAAGGGSFPERIAAAGIGILHGWEASEVTVTAVFDDGSTDSATHPVASAQEIVEAAENRNYTGHVTFFGFQAPEGRSIQGLDIAFGGTWHALYELGFLLETENGEESGR